MKNETKMILAVGVLVFILTFYPVYLKWVSPPTAKVGQTTEVNTEQRARAVEPAKNLEKLTPPPVSNSQEELYDLDNGNLSVTFSSLGGSVKRLEEKLFTKIHGDSATLIDIEKGLRGAFAVIFPFEKSDFDRADFKRDKSLEKDGNTIAFSAVKDGKLKITKIYSLAPAANTLQLEVLFENVGTEPQEIKYEISNQMRFNDVEEKGADQSSLETGCRVGAKVDSKNFGAVSKKGFLKEGILEWAFLSKKYFVTIVDPEETNFERTRALKLNQNEMANFNLMPSFQLAAGGKLKQHFSIYAGSKEYNALKSCREGYEMLLSKGFFGVFRVWMLLALQFFYGWVHNWGWSIIIMTCFIKLAFTPLTHMSYDSMRKMQVLQPKIKAIQEKYKKDPQKMNQEVMAFYKKHKVNPLGGCLPLLLQMPIFIAFYQVLSQAIELKGAPFIFWIKDLSAPDKLFTLSFSLPFIGDGINILPILMLGSMIWQQKLTPMTTTSPEQAKIMTFMPVIFGFMFYNLPSGLVLYWTINNLLTIFHQLFIKRFLPHPPIAD